MKIINTDLDDLLIFEPTVFEDNRGFFFESFRESWMQENGLDYQFVQENHSCSSKGVLRGLHYQINNAQGKLVRVLRGEVYDVAVDIRRTSDTFGRYVGVYLTGENRRQFWVPPGFAHGFLVMSEEAEFVYKCTEYYSPKDERSIAWNDPEIAIEWPVKDMGGVVLSAKDAEASSLADAEVFE